MICKVIANFKDKNTGIVHNTGEEYECTEERFEEINSAHKGVKLLECDDTADDSGEGVRESVKSEDAPAKKRRTAKKSEGDEVAAE